MAEWFVHLTYQNYGTCQLLILLTDARSYVAPVQIGEIMRGACVGVVVASRSVRFPIGSYATGVTGWTELAIIHARQLDKVEIPAHGKITDALGVLGLTGLTAYFGIIDVGNVKKGDFVVVSGAAGATGSIVGQIAKLKGATVLGIAGSDAKVQWLRDELGFDAALNYKDLDFRKKFRMATMEMIDVFFDNVGGDLLDLALTRAKPHSRFVMCGGISQYNKAHPEGPKNYLMIISMRIRMQGFIVFDYRDRFAEGRMELGRWLADGKIKRQETLVRGGLKNAERALIDLYKGSNIGKTILPCRSGR